MNIGISLACFYPMVPEEVVSLAAQAKVEQCEVFLNTVSELNIDYLKRVRHSCDCNNIQVHSIHPFTSAIENYMFFMPYERRIRDAVDFYKRYAEAASILGAKVINIHGDRGLALKDYNAYLSCVGPLLDLQKETGIVYSMENVYYNSVNHPEIVVRLRKDLPDIGFTFDIKQAHKGGQDPYDLLDAMGESVVNFHVNDHDDENLCLLPGKGNVDYISIFSMLKKFRYEGPALIEVYRDNFGSLSELIDSKKWLESQLMLAN